MPWQTNKWMPGVELLLVSRMQRHLLYCPTFDNGVRPGSSLCQEPRSSTCAFSVFPVMGRTLAFSRPSLIR